MRAFVWCGMLALAGCGTSAGLYAYRVVSNDCQCDVYHLTDEKARVSYTFSGAFSIDEDVRTRLTLSIRNDNRDTLDLSLAYMTVTSRNIPYQYNGKPRPVTIVNIPPGKERTVLLEGEAGEKNNEGDPWLQMAGEEVTLTVEGMRLNGKPVSAQVIRCVPRNPNLTP